MHRRRLLLIAAASGTALAAGCYAPGHDSSRLSGAADWQQPTSEKRPLYAAGVGDSLGGAFLEPMVLARIRERDEHDTGIRTADVPTDR